MRALCGAIITAAALIGLGLTAQGIGQRYTMERAYYSEYDRAEKDTDAKGDAKAAPTPRTGTKQAQLIEMLRAPEGASIDEIVAATGWQPHTVRGAIAGALKKKLGLEVTSEKVEGVAGCIASRAPDCSALSTAAVLHRAAVPSWQRSAPARRRP